VRRHFSLKPSCSAFYLFLFCGHPTTLGKGMAVLCF